MKLSTTVFIIEIWTVLCWGGVADTVLVYNYWCWMSVEENISLTFDWWAFNIVIQYSVESPTYHFLYVRAPLVQLRLCCLVTAKLVTFNSNYLGEWTLTVKLQDYLICDWSKWIFIIESVQALKSLILLNNAKNCSSLAVL